MKVRVFALMALVGVPSWVGAVDFIRGDANSDGVVSVSDAQLLIGYLFLSASTVECIAAMDVDDNGQLQLTDAVVLVRAQYMGAAAPPAPFPSAGPDPTSPAAFPCDSFGNGTPLDVPGSKLQVIHAVAKGGSERRAVITIAFSSTQAISGYAGKLRDNSGVLEGPDSEGEDAAEGLLSMVDRSGSFDNGFMRARYFDQDLQFFYLSAITGISIIAAGEDIVLADIVACVRPGTPAGEYPLTLVTGELVPGCELVASDLHCKEKFGRAILPALSSGTLVVENDVAVDAGCDTTVPSSVPIKIKFQLEESTAVAGGNATVPFLVRIDRPSQGFSYSVHYDTSILTSTGTDKVFQNPAGAPYEFERFESNDSTGYVVGAAILSLTDTTAVLPPNQDNEVLRFRFHVNPGAPPGETALEFLDGGIGTGGPVTNKLYADGDEITPDVASSFVFINGLINIVPDAMPFVRGDSNSDDAVNISDASFTLGYLFLGSTEPKCPDSADANDDGRIDISDAVATLQFLFTGETLLPPPRVPGTDPTTDGLTCG